MAAIRARIEVKGPSASQISNIQSELIPIHWASPFKDGDGTYVPPRTLCRVHIAAAVAATPVAGPALPKLNEILVNELVALGPKPALPVRIEAGVDINGLLKVWVIALF